MRLEHDDFRALTFGAVQIEQTPDGVRFHRFSPEEENWLAQKESYEIRSRSGSGIMLDFESDAKRIRFHAVFRPGSSRKWAFFDFDCDGILIAHGGSPDIHDRPECDFEVELDGASHRCTLHFPQLACAVLKDFELEGATFVKSRTHRRRILFYGDSITQGYDAVHPELTYTALLASEFDAEEQNRAIGGAIFHPDFVRLAPAGVPKPDLIVSAYGTNDWSKCTGEDFTRQARDFFTALNEVYPGVPVAALQPIWRKDCESITAAGRFEDARRIVTEAAACHPLAQVIPGDGLVPHRAEFFADGKVHPGDLGFSFYARNLIREIHRRFPGFAD